MRRDAIIISGYIGFTRDRTRHVAEQVATPPHAILEQAFAPCDLKPFELTA